jgi:tRNA(Ile)-lysidine synthase
MGARAEAAGSLLDAFESRLERTRLIPPGSNVVVAVSGGLDSVVLLHLLRAAHRLDVRLCAAHFDHAMRPDSAADAEWVRALCHEWGVQCQVGRAATAPTSEAGARAARYAYLFDVAQLTGAESIAVAHHADDQAETVLFRLMRGTSLAGLSGIPERRGMIVRPLLMFRRARLQAHARTAALAWREDPTNVDLRFARNRIRHVILPALERTRPGATDAILQLAEEARAAEVAWNQIIDDLERVLVIRTTDAGFQLARDALLGYHPHVRARLMRRLLGRLGPTPSRAATRAVLAFIRSGTSGGAIQLAGGLRLERQFDRLVIRLAPGTPSADQPLVIREPRAGRGDAQIGGRRVTVEWSLANGTDGVGAAFDPAALQFPLELRAWRPGDRVRTSQGTKKLKKLFVERRLPRSERRRTPVLAQVDGRILWVVGVVRARGAEPVPGSPVFQIRVTDADIA